MAIQVIEFSKALYQTKCPICDERVEWEAQFDADGTVYLATCCGHEFFMGRPLLVEVEITPPPSATGTTAPTPGTGSA
jgi:hypothetical protein